METERTDYYKLEKLCAEERLSAPVGVDYAVSLHEMNWFRFDGCEPSGKFSESGLMQVEKNVQVYMDKEWHPVIFYTTSYSGPCAPILQGTLHYHDSPAGRLIDPEKAAQAVKDSVDRGTPTREIATASRYLMLAAVSICTDSMNAFEHYLDASEGYQRENAEYMVLDGRKAAAQIQSILGVMSELEGLEEHE